MDDCVLNKLENINIHYELVEGNEFPGRNMFRFVMYRGDKIPQINQIFDESDCKKDANLLGYIYGEITDDKYLFIEYNYICEDKRGHKYSILLFLYMLYKIKEDEPNIKDVELEDGTKFGIPFDGQVNENGSVTIWNDDGHEDYDSLDTIIKKNIYFRLGFGAIIEWPFGGNDIPKYSDNTVEGWKNAIDNYRRASINTVLEKGREMIGC